VDTDHARSVIEQALGNIPRRPEPPQHTVDLPRDMNVTWDINVSAVYLVYPGPYEDPKTRAALVAFGSYLNQYIVRSAETPELTRTTYTTNPTYSLHELPFFVFAQVAPFRSSADVGQWLGSITDEAIASVDENKFGQIITALKGLVQSSYLESHRNNYEIENFRVIGQHALSIGIVHYLRDGLSVDEYTQLLDSITFEEMQQILREYLSPDRRRVVTITPR
jgi:predicted Zn-dependent peptidase